MIKRRTFQLFNRTKGGNTGTDWQYVKDLFSIFSFFTVAAKDQCVLERKTERKAQESGNHLKSFEFITLKLFLHSRKISIYLSRPHESAKPPNTSNRCPRAPRAIIWVTAVITMGESLYICPLNCRKDVVIHLGFHVFRVNTITPLAA